MDLLNLTGFPVRFELPSGEIVTYMPSGMIAKVASDDVIWSKRGKTTITRLKGEVYTVSNYSATNGLPEGKRCIVSPEVLAALPAGTEGVYAPDTGDSAIWENGSLFAITRFLVK